MGIGIRGQLKVDNFRISAETISFEVAGIHYSFSLSDISPILAGATDKERNDYRFSPSGYGVHWDLLNEDLSIQSLINSKSGK